MEILTKKSLFDDLMVRLDEILSSSMPAEEKLHFVVNMLRNDVAYYDWVGFYLVDKNVPDELELGVYAGEETDHTRIKFGQGICGQAASTLKNFVVQDVSKEHNYLSCSIKVKSEIVLPIFHAGKLIGELDIDSHTLSPFSDDDVQFLEGVCQRVAPLLA